MKWTRKKFSELYAIPSRNGLNRPSRVRGEGFKMVNMGELFANDRIGNIPMDRVPMSDKEVEQCTLVEGDLLFARQSLVLEGAGKCSYILEAPEPTTFESHLIRVRLDKNKADPLFYYYLFGSPYSGISTIVQQCAQAGIRGSELGNLEVIYPKPEVQRDVAARLGACDDLMENNRRRMDLLGNTARLLYREWFGRLRFPGYEHTCIINGVPEGWERKRVQELLSFTIGGGWGSDEHNAQFTEPAYVIRGTDLPDIKAGTFGGVPYRFHVPKNLASRQLQSGDIILEISNGNIRNIGRSHRLEPRVLQAFDRQVMCASFCRLMRPHGERESHILASHLEEIQANGRMDFFKTPSAAGINNFRFTGLLEDEAVLIPPGALLEEFVAQVSSIRTQLANLAVMNNEIRAARDLLLPRLMSGEITV